MRGRTVEGGGVADLGAVAAADEGDSGPALQGARPGPVLRRTIATRCAPALAPPPPSAIDPVSCAVAHRLPDAALPEADPADVRPVEVEPADVEPPGAEAAAPDAADAGAGVGVGVTVGGVVCVDALGPADGVLGAVEDAGLPGPAHPVSATARAATVIVGRMLRARCVVMVPGCFPSSDPGDGRGDDPCRPGG